MGVDILTPAEVMAACTDALGLDATAMDLTAHEALAAALRRTASFRCPITPAGLVALTARPLEGLAGDGPSLRETLAGILESLVASGDLLEVSEVDNATLRRRRMLYLGPPAFVRRSGGAFLLLGVRPEGASLVGESLAVLIEHEHHLRIINAASGTDIATLLDDYGLHEVSQEVWLRCPLMAPAIDVLREKDLHLEAAGPSGEIPGLRLLDAAAPTNYYKGRWREPSARDTGRYVARRTQAYGSDLWCYVEVVGGQPQRFVDFPLDGSLARGADEAWHLQAAIDAVRGHPQRVRVTRDASVNVLSLFAPPPSWLQRRWDRRGLPIAARGALVSYALMPGEVEEELAFVTKMLWLDIDVEV